MNILFMFFKPIKASDGGVERVTSILSKEFTLAGHQVYYLCTTPQSTTPSYNSQQLYLTKGISIENQLINIVNRFNIDRVINNDFSQESADLLEKLPASVKIISVFHNMPFATYRQERRILLNLTPKHFIGKCFKYFGIIFPFIIREFYLNNQRQIFNKLIKASDKYALLSDRFIPRFNKIIGKYDTKKIIIFNNPNTFNNINVTEEEKENIILFVGRIENTSKNVSDFIRVWNNIYPKYPTWKAIVVGDGSDLKRITLLSNSLGCKNISFEGKQENVIQYYRKAKFLCITSIYEGWGMNIAEAMACKCVPIAYTSFEAVYDLIDNYKNGVLIPPFKTKIMEEELQKLIINNELRQEMAENASEKIKKFSPNIIAAKWLQVLETL